MLSMVGAPSMKCSGASMCVPVCMPITTRLTLQSAPSDMRMGRVIEIAGSPGHTTMSSCRGTLTSTQLKTRPA